MIDIRMRMATGIVALALLCSCATYRLDPTVSIELEEQLGALAQLEYGHSRAPAEALAGFLAMHAVTPSQRRAIEPQWVALAEDPSATRAGRQQAIQILGRLGTGHSAQALIDLLSDPALGEDAAMALQRMTDPQVAPQVLASLSSSRGIARERSIAVLGALRHTDAIPALAAAALDSDERVAAAAVIALGRMAAPEATVELIDALPLLTGRAREAAWPALLQGQEAALAAADDPVVFQVTRALDQSSPPLHVLAASKRAVLNGAAPQEAERAVSELLASTQVSLQSIGAELARQLLPDSQLLSVSQSLPSLPVPSQIAVLGILEDRGLSAAAPLIAERVSASAEAVQCAALRALGQAGDAASLPAIAGASVSEIDAVRQVAASSLRLVSGPDIDAGLVDLARTADPGVRVEILAAMGDRGMADALPILFESVDDPERVVRRAAIRELGALVGPADWPRLLDLVVSVQTDADRQAWVSAAGEAGTRVPDRGGAVASRLATATNAHVRVDLLQLAGQLRDDTTLGALADAAADPHAEIRRSALRALGNWKSLRALPPLVAAASETDEPSRRLAVRGALQVLRQAVEVEDVERIAQYRAIAEHIEHVDDRRLLLAAVSELKHPAAAAVAAAYLDQADVRAEAEIAVLRIAKNTSELNDHLRAALERMASESGSPATKNEANLLLNR